MKTMKPVHVAPSRRSQQGGMAVIAIIALLAILMIYVAGNIRTLHFLGRELAHIEQKQVARLKASQTNNSVALLTLTNLALPNPATAKASSTP